MRTESDDNTVTDENKYQTAFKQEAKMRNSVPETQALNLNDRSISNKEYFSFVNQ